MAGLEVPPSVAGTLLIRNVHLPQRDSDASVNDQLYDVYCANGVVDKVQPSTGRTSSADVTELDARGRGILLPAYVITILMSTGSYCIVN